MTTIKVKGTTPNPKKETVKIGSYFVNSEDELFVLARVEEHKCCLICTFGGNRFTNQTDIKINDNKITREDFLKVCAGKEFTEVKAVDITFER